MSIASLFRRTISFTKRQLVHLQGKAALLETSMAEVVRRLVDEDIDKK